MIKYLLWTLSSLVSIVISYFFISMLSPIPSQADVTAISSEVDTNRLLQVQMNKHILKELKEIKSDIRLYILRNGNYAGTNKGKQRKAI